MGPPSSGGVILIEMLNMLELAGRRPDTAARLHLLAECMRRAFADRAATMGDADFAEVPVDRLLSREHARERLADLDETAATESRQVAAGELAEESPQTTHLSVVDPAGSAVAITTTINGNFGSGVTVKGAGFLLNNEMDDFTSRPGIPNMFGLLQGQANAIAPGKRPLSAMTPTLVKQDGKVLLVLGSPGGPTIINTVLQIILNVLDEGMDLYEAVDEPGSTTSGCPTGSSPKPAPCPGRSKPSWSLWDTKWSIAAGSATPTASGWIPSAAFGKVWPTRASGARPAVSEKKSKSVERSATVPVFQLFSLSSFLFPRLSGTDQDEPEVHHVGLGGAGDDEAARLLEKVVGVVGSQVGLGIESQQAGPSCGFRCGPGPGRVGGAIVAVGTDGRDEHRLLSPTLHFPGAPEGELLVPAAFSRSGDSDRGLASGDDATGRGDREAAPEHFPGDAHVTLATSSVLP